MEEELTTTNVPMEQQIQPSPHPTNRRRLVLVGIVLTMIGILYVLYRLLTPSQRVVPSNTITIQKNMQKQQLKTTPRFQVFRQDIQQQRRKLRNIKM